MTPIMGPSHLVNPLVSVVQLEASASQLDGVSKELEDSVRYETARLLQAAGVLLRLPQEVIAQAIIILNRYWVGADGGSLLEVDAKVSYEGKGMAIPTSSTSLTSARTLPPPLSI